MKRRLQFILGLLAIAITVSMIAVTLGWYSVEIDINFDTTEATITTAENNYYGGSTSLSCKGILTYDSETTVYSLNDYESYLGQSCISGQDYIVLFEASSPIYSLSRSGYVNSCTITKPSELTYEYDKTNSPFRVVLLNINEDGRTYVEATSGETFTYIAVIYGDGTNIFPFADSAHKGTKFTLNIMLEN